MSTKYISPVKLYARVREELKSFFYTGSVDDLLFGIWTADVLDIFENTYRPIQECVMDMHDYKCDLPCNFYSVREVWMVATFNKGPIISPFVFYYQTDCRINPAPSDDCNSCTPGYQCIEPVQQPVNLPSLCNVPQEYQCTHKVMTQLSFNYRVTAMLKPGNFKTVERCESKSPNREATCIDTFDITGNHMRTSFRIGSIYMAYYTQREPDPETGYYMIPDNDPFQKYLYYYLRYMVYQQMVDQSSGDQLQEVLAKMRMEEQKKDAHYIDARNYAMSDDIYGLEKRIVRSYNRHNRYLIPGPATRGGGGHRHHHGY